MERDIGITIVNEAEVLGVVYVTTQGHKCQSKEDDPCKGCVGQKDSNICCRLPETCTLKNKIWIVKQ